MQGKDRTHQPSHRRRLPVHDIQSVAATEYPGRRGDHSRPAIELVRRPHPGRSRLRLAAESSGSRSDRQRDFDGIYLEVNAANSDPDAKAAFRVSSNALSTTNIGISNCRRTNTQPPATAYIWFQHVVNAEIRNNRFFYDPLGDVKLVKLEASGNILLATSDFVGREGLVEVNAGSSTIWLGSSSPSRAETDIAINAENLPSAGEGLVIGGGASKASIHGDNTASRPLSVAAGYQYFARPSGSPSGSTGTPGSTPPATSRAPPKAARAAASLHRRVTGGAARRRALAPAPYDRISCRVTSYNKVRMRATKHFVGS